MAVLTSTDKCFKIDGVLMSFNSRDVTPLSNGVRFTNKSTGQSIDVSVTGTTLNGTPATDVESILDFVEQYFFSLGGGSGDGAVLWDDTSMLPVSGKVPVYSSQGLLSTGTPEFPENCVPLYYLKSVINSLTGWAVYNDGIYTESNPLVIPASSRVKITNNASVVINNHLPQSVTTFWDNINNKITPDRDGDSYIVNVRFIASSTSNQGLADVEIDIGGTLNVVSGTTISMRKGIGASQRININFDVYTGSTFLTNGGEIYVTSIDGNTSIHDIRFKITRVHKAI